MRRVIVDALALRVAARHEAMEFPNPKALKDYLHDHPGADKSKHTVVSPEDHGSKPHEEKPKKSWKDLVSGLSEKAKSFVTSAPKAIKDFVHDENFRRGALQSAHKMIEDAPGAFIKGVIKHGKDEAHEIKTAGQGLVSILKGKKMTHEEKHALRKVATHVAIAATATALTGGLGLGALGLAKGTAGSFISSLAKKIALKAVTDKLEILPTIEELGHAGHGAAHTVSHMFQHFMHHASDDSGEPEPEAAFEAFVAATVAQALKNLDPDTLSETLEEMAENKA